MVDCSKLSPDRRKKYESIDAALKEETEKLNLLKNDEAKRLQKASLEIDMLKSEMQIKKIEAQKAWESSKLKYDKVYSEYKQLCSDLKTVNNEIKIKKKELVNIKKLNLLRKENESTHPIKSK